MAPPRRGADERRHARYMKPKWRPSSVPPDRSSTTPTDTAISAGSGTTRSKRVVVPANGCPAPATFTCSATFNGWQRTELRLTKTLRGLSAFRLPAAMYRDRLPTVALQDPRPRRQRLDGPASRLCPPRGAGRRDQRLHGAVLATGRVLSTGAATTSTSPASKKPADLTRPTSAWPRNAKRVGTYREFTEKILPIIKRDGIQRRADGHRRAPLLRVVRLPRVEFLRPHRRAAGLPRS